MTSANGEAYAGQCPFDSWVHDCVVYRDENRFRFDKGQNNRLPINSPTFIRSDRIAKNNDPDSITDKRGGDTQNIHGSTPQSPRLLPPKNWKHRAMGSTVATPGHIAAVVRVAHHDDRCGVHGKPWEKTGCLVRVRSKTQMFWIVELLHYWIVFCYHGPSPWSRLHDVSNDTYSYIRYHIYICKYTSKYDTSNFCYCSLAAYDTRNTKSPRPQKQGMLRRCTTAAPKCRNMKN